MKKGIMVSVVCLSVLTADLFAAHVHDWNADTLTDGFFGLNDVLAESGIEAGFCLTSIYQHNVSGGLSKDGQFAGSYDLELTFDLERLLDMPGSVYMHGEGGWSDGIDEAAVGSAFGLNFDVVGPRTFDVAELYYQVNLTDKLEMTLGKIDFFAFFDGSEYAGDETTQFLNSALVHNPAVPFPQYALSVILNYHITDDWYVMAAAADAEAIGNHSGFDTAFDGDTYFLYMAETGVSTRVDSLSGVYRMGFWYDPRPKAYTSGPDQTDDLGFYLNGDQMLVKENDDVDDTQGLGGFFRYGYAPDDKNDFTQFYSFGVQYQGLIDGRDDDVLGLGYANGIFSNKASAVYPADYESVFEAYYSAVVTNSITLSPSVQYVTNPGGSTTVDDAVVLGLRAQIAF